MMRRWLPGADPLREDVWRDVDNMVPTPRGTYHTMPTFSSATLTGGNAGTANYVTYLAWTTQIANGTAVTYIAGETSSGSGNFYVESLSGTTLTNRSTGGTNFGTGFDGTKIAFAQMGNTSLFASNDPSVGGLWSRDASGSSNFAIGNLSAGRILVVQSNALLMYNLVDGGAAKPNYWMASDLFAPTTFTGGESVSATAVVTTPGEITAAVPFGGVSIFFKRAGVYRHRYVGTSAVKWTVECLRTDLGVKSRHAVIDTGNSIIFLGEMGVWEYDGGNFRCLSEDFATGYYLTNPLANFYSCTASMYFPADQMCVWFNSTGCLFYNRRTGAFGRGTFYAQSDGSALTGYVPITGKVSALVEAAQIGGAGSYSFIEGMSLVNVSAARYRQSDQSWRGANSAYVKTSVLGDYMTDTTIDQVVPKLRDGHGVYTFASGYVADDGLSCVVNGTTVNSSTDRKRFDVGTTFTYPDGVDVKIQSRGSGYNGVWEIEDVILDNKMTGQS